MTREEAIKDLKDILEEATSDKDAVCYVTSEDAEALDMAIEALSAESEFEWCTDCKEYDQDRHCCHRWTKVIRNTVEELKEHYDGYVEVVRCKDCRWYKYDSYCSKTEAREIDADNFCSYGERRKNV